MLRYFYRIIGWKHFKKVLFVLFVGWLYYYFWVLPSPIPVKRDPSAAHLSDAEAEYYIKTFDYVMDLSKQEVEQQWQTYSGSGIISVGAPFKSASGYQCRPFSERYTVGKITGAATGFGCKRDGSDGWCKLRPDQPQNCALEPPKTLFGRIKQAVHDDYNYGTTMVKGTIDFW